MTTIKKAVGAPNTYLTNVGLSYFAAANGAAQRIFPIVSVPTKTGNFFTFNKGDIARDDVQRKPQFGHVQPALIGGSDNLYNTEIDQVLIGIDEFDEIDRQRRKVITDPLKLKTRLAMEKLQLHLDILFGTTFMKEGVWTNELTGTATTPSGQQFYQFDDANSDPVTLITSLKRQIKREGRREPNKLAVGAYVFDALVNHPLVTERVKYSGSTVNPAVVNENVLAQLFGLKDVVVLDASYNASIAGDDADMQFAADPYGVLLTYATETPDKEEPSAGYTFAWDIFGNGDGNYLYVAEVRGDDRDHARFVEGLMAYDMKVTAQDLGVYLKKAVAAK